ncbi:MAG: hypothetical protein P8P49_11910 [Opitutales bacterium]|nr:hypothetical protein [Opitutales bacterium]
MTGKSNLAHELKGYGSWKFITEGGEHYKTLSLLSEFSLLDPTYLEISWNQLTFTTYLQPSEKATNFRIVAGDPSVPAFNAISSATLNISSSGGANACFSITGTGHFGPLPEIHQPIVEEDQNSVETVRIEPVYDEAPLQAKHPTTTPVQPKSPTKSPTPKISRRKSNLNQGKPGDFENLYDSADIPKGKGADGKSKLLILLISFFSFLVLGAAIFAGVYFWPEKAKRGNTHSPEVAKAKIMDELDVNESKISLEEKERIVDDNEKSKVSERGPANKKIEETSKSENPPDSLLNKSDQEERPQNPHPPSPLPQVIPLDINGSSTVSEFSFDDSGKPENPEKTFYWDHKNKNCTEVKQGPMHEAYWTTVKRIEDGSGTKIQIFHLLKDQKISYKVDKKSFPKLKIDDANFSVISSSKIPDLKFKLDDKDVRITKRKERTVNFFRALNKLTVKEFWAKSNLKYELFHENGPATNKNGELLTKDSNKLAGLSEYFHESPTAILIRDQISNIVKYIDELISANEGQEKNYNDSKQELNTLLKSQLDFSKKHEETEIEITDKAISKITKFTFHNKLSSDIKSVIKNTFKKKNLFKYNKSSETYKFFDWYELKESCVDYKKESYDKKISDAKDKLNQLNKRKKGNEKLQNLEEEIEESKNNLSEVRKDSHNFEYIFPKEPKEFKKFKTTLEKCLSAAIRKQKPLSEKEVKSLKEYKNNLQNFLEGPQYPWQVENKTSKNIVLIIE